MKLKGRVVADGQRGIPGVIVHALSQQGGAPPQRLGSVSTDAHGDFTLDVDEAATAAQAAVRLTITAPGDAAGVERVLATTAPRLNPGRVEAFLVQLDRKILDDAQLAIPSGEAQGQAEVGDVVARAVRVAERRTQLARGLADAAAPHIDAALAQVEAREAMVELRLRRDLGLERAGAGDFVVGSEDRLGALQTLRVRERMTAHQTSMRRRVTLPISAAELDRLRAAPTSDALTGAALERCYKAAVTTIATASVGRGSISSRRCAGSTIAQRRSSTTPVPHLSPDRRPRC